MGGADRLPGRVQLEVVWQETPQGPSLGSSGLILSLGRRASVPGCPQYCRTSAIKAHHRQEPADSSLPAHPAAPVPQAWGLAPRESMC